MTKSEAKAIEQRAVQLVQALNGVNVTKGGLDWSVIAAGGQAAVQHVNTVLATARDRAHELLEIATAELPGRK